MFLIPSPRVNVQKPNIWSKQNAGVSARSAKDAEQLAEERSSLDAARWVFSSPGGLQCNREETNAAHSSLFLSQQAEVGGEGETLWTNDKRRFSRLVNYPCFLFTTVSTRHTCFVSNLLCNASDEETEGLFLVDFTQKIIDKKREMLAQKETEKEDEERLSSSPVPPPQNPDEEW